MCTAAFSHIWHPKCQIDDYLQSLSNEASQVTGQFKCHAGPAQ
jgi:hypothetical protein